MLIIHGSSTKMKEKKHQNQQNASNLTKLKRSWWGLYLCGGWNKNASQPCVVYLNWLFQEHFRIPITISDLIQAVFTIYRSSSIITKTKVIMYLNKVSPGLGHRPLDERRHQPESALHNLNTFYKSWKEQFVCFRGEYKCPWRWGQTSVFLWLFTLYFRIVFSFSLFPTPQATKKKINSP